VILWLETANEFNPTVQNYKPSHAFVRSFPVKRRNNEKSKGGHTALISLLLERFVKW
jgi:hypothetical protein